MAAETGYEAGYIAIGIGVLCGLAVTRLGRGRGGAFAATAIGAALLGILIGQYGVFVYAWNEAANDVALLAGGKEMLESLGFPEPLQLGYLSSEGVSQFREHADLVFGSHDVLWVGLAALGAAQLSRARS